MLVVPTPGMSVGVQKPVGADKVQAGLVRKQLRRLGRQRKILFFQG